MNSLGLQPFHGKALTLDMGHNQVPFPFLFMIHEICARGFYPFEPVVPSIPDNITMIIWKKEPCSTMSRVLSCMQALHAIVNDTNTHSAP